MLFRSGIHVVAFGGLADQAFGAVTVNAKRRPTGAPKRRFGRQVDGCMGFKARGGRAEFAGELAGGRRFGIDKELATVAIVDDLGNLRVGRLEEKKKGGESQGESGKDTPTPGNLPKEAGFA